MSRNEIAAHAVVLALLLMLPAIGHAQEGLVPAGCEGPNCKFTHVVELVQRVIKFLLTIAIPIAAVMFSWAGFLYLTSAGDTGKVKTAHSIMTSVFVGLALALGAYLIINLLTNFFLKKDAEDVFKKSTRHAYPIYERV